METAPAQAGIRYFDQIAQAYAQQAAHDPCFTERLDLFSGLIDELRAEIGDGLAVDLGCGSGVIARYLAQSGLTTIGIDGSSAMLRQARSGLRDESALELRHASLPLSEHAVTDLEQRVAILVASSVIEYIDDDRLFLEQCGRMLQPGGVGLVSFANGGSLYRRAERLTQRLPRTASGVSSLQRHQHTETIARQLVADAGLETRSVHFYTLPAHRYLRRFVRGRPAWLATLLLLVVHRPQNVQAEDRGACRVQMTGPHSADQLPR